MGGKYLQYTYCPVSLEVRVIRQLTELFLFKIMQKNESWRLVSDLFIF